MVEPSKGFADSPPEASDSPHFPQRRKCICPNARGRAVACLRAYEQLTQRTLNASKTLSEYMCINLCNTNIRMAQQRLYRTNVTAPSQQLGSKCGSV